VGTLVLLIATLVAGPAAAPPIGVDVRSRAVRPGEILAITIGTAQPARSVAATLGDRQVALWRVSSRTWRGVIGLDVEQAPGPLVLAVTAQAETGATITVSRTLIVVPANFPERRLTVPPRFVDPPPEARPRIEREAVALHAIYDRPPSDRRPEGFVAPVPHRRSSPFGSRSIFNGQARDRHSGLDFASPAGAVVHAPAAGRVALVDDLYFTGNTVVLDHGAGVYSILAHMQRTFVRVGEDVPRGARLGTVGATGRATAPHLHWSVRVGGARVDPASVLDVLKPGDERLRRP
jgi:murein DD-endopeptidase MepM/ murein hydrolase activator NlpD